VSERRPGGRAVSYVILGCWLLARLGHDGKDNTNSRILSNDLTFGATWPVKAAPISRNSMKRNRMANRVLSARPNALENKNRIEYRKIFSLDSAPWWSTVVRTICLAMQDGEVRNVTTMATTGIAG
jgi:hypothetical protein